MARTLLLFVLAIAIVLELVLTVGALFFPAFTLAQFGVVYGPETTFLAYLTGWFLLFVTLAAGLAVGAAAPRRLRGPVLPAGRLVDWHWHRHFRGFRQAG